MTEKNLKTGLRRVKFGEVVKLSKERCSDPVTEGYERFVGLEHLEPGDLRIRSWGNVSDGTTFTSVFKPGQVLFGKRRAYQRKVAVADFTGVCSGDIYVLESANPSLLLPDLLPFLCQTEAFFEHAVGTSAGSLSPRTNWTSLAEFEFTLASVEEQRKVCLLLSAIEENITELDRALSSLILFEFSKLENTVESISDDWLIPTEKLIITGIRNGLSPKVNSDQQGFPTLSISAVRNGYIVTEGNIKFADVTPEQASSFSLKKNDVLIVRGNGNKLLTGKCGIVDKVPPGCFYPDLLIRVEFNSNVIRPQFAALQWNTPSVHKRLISRAKSTNGIWKINGGDIRQHKLKVPEIKFQDAFLGEFSEIRQARVEIEGRKNRAKSLKFLALKELEWGIQNGF
jgi:type I restriction enzyme S subunit